MASSYTVHIWSSVILGINRHQKEKELHLQEGHAAQEFTSGKSSHIAESQ